jgi:hypothetical protein
VGELSPLRMTRQVGHAGVIFQRKAQGVDQRHLNLESVDIAWLLL